MGTSILWMTPDLTNLPKTKVKVAQRMNTLTTILPMVVMTEMMGMTLMALTLTPMVLMPVAIRL